MARWNEMNWNGPGTIAGLALAGLAAGLALPKLLRLAKMVGRGGFGSTYTSGTPGSPPDVDPASGRAG